jgi:plasmid stability protein
MVSMCYIVALSFVVNPFVGTMQISAQPDMVRTTLNLDDDLMRLVRQRAAAEGRTMTSLVEEGLRGMLRSRERQVAPYEVELPTFSGGGPAPGVDLADYQQLNNLIYADEDAHYRSAAGDAAASEQD